MSNLFKSIGLIFFVLAYMFIPTINEILSYNINYMYISSVVAESFYEEVTSVSTDENTIVKDYLIENDKLYIFPLGNEIKLPIGVMVSSKSNNYLEVVSLSDRYYIYNLDYINVNIYQYINYNESLGFTTDYYIIEGDNLDRITNQLEIYYEKV